MQISHSLLFAAAIGAGNVAALPSAHHHRHADLHKDRAVANRAVGDLVTAVIDGEVVTWTNTYSGSDDDDAAADTTSISPTTTAVAANNYEAVATTSSTSTTAAATSTASSSSTVTEYTDFCSSSKRATAEEIAYTGNTGSCGWGSNWLLISASIADKYDYTIKVTGNNTVDWKVVCTNKIGPDGLIDGWYGHEAIAFTLAAGETQWIAVEANTQGICVAAAGTTIPTDQYGGYASTWLEIDFADSANSGWSGMDVSSIQAEAAGLSVQGMKACHSSTCSAIGTDLSFVSNAFDLALKLADGIGANITPGAVTLDVIIAYTGTS